MVEEEVEQVEQQDPPSKTRLLYDAVSKEYDLGKYEEFESKLQDPAKRKAFYEGVGKEYDLGTYEEFESKVGVKKKSTPVSTTTSVQSEYAPPSTEVIEEIPSISAERIEEDPISLTQKAFQLGIKPQAQKAAMDLGAIMEEEPKFKEETGQDIKNRVREQFGIDADELYKEVKGLDETDFGKQGFSKTELLTDRQENPQVYQRKIARLKWQKGLDAELSSKLIDGRLTKDEYDNINNAVVSSLENSNVGDYKQQRENINTVANAIKQFGGENKEELIKNYAIEVGKVYGNSYNNNFEAAAAETPEGKYIPNTDAQLGYQYLKDISPEKTKQYERLFIDPKNIKDLSPYEKKGYDHLMQTLEETGIGLQLNSVREELNNLSLIAKNNEGLTPEQLQKATELEKKQEELSQKSNELDKKYPEKVDDKVDDALQEILGQRLGFLNYAGGMAGKAIKSTGEGIWEAVSSPFMSDASNSLRELAIMGETLDENKVYHKTDVNKNLLTDRLVIEPELQSQIDAIKNDKALTEEQKEQKLYPLLKDNLDKFGRVPIQGGKFNIRPSSIIYGVTDIAATLLPFIGLETITGGGATAGALRKFTSTFTAAAATSFHDEYANAVLEGLPQSEAYKRALGMTAINSFAMAGAGTAEAVKKMAATKKTSASKIIEGMSDDAIQKVLNKGVPKPMAAISDRLKAMPKMFKEGAKAGANFEVAMTLGNEAKTQLYDTPIDREQNFKQSLLGILNFGIMGVGLGNMGYKSPTELQKSGLVEMALKPDDFIKVAEEMRADGKLTPAEFEHRKGLIEKSAEAFKTLPQVNDKGKPLSADQKADYIFNSIVKKESKTSASNLPPKQAAKAEHTGMVADYKNELILDPKTDKQLEDRLGILERELEPKKDPDGKVTELPEKEKAKYEAEIEAIKDVLEKNKSEKVYYENNERIQEEGSGVGGEVKNITITGYRNKGSKDVGENGTFYTQSEQNRPTNKKEISFDNALVLTDEQVEQFEGLPNEYLAYEWFPDVDFTKEAKRQGISESGLLMDKMVAEEAVKRGYDGIIYGTNEILDLRTHLKAEQSLPTQEVKDNTKPTISKEQQPTDVPKKDDGFDYIRNKFGEGHGGKQLSERESKILTSNVDKLINRAEKENGVERNNLKQSTWRTDDGYVIKEFYENGQGGTRVITPKGEEINLFNNKYKNESGSKISYFPKAQEVKDNTKPTISKEQQPIDVSKEASAKAKEISEAEKPPIELNFDVTKDQLAKYPLEVKDTYIRIKKEHALLKKILKDCL